MSILKSSSGVQLVLLKSNPGLFGCNFTSLSTTWVNAVVVESAEFSSPQYNAKCSGYLLLNLRNQSCFSCSVIEWNILGGRSYRTVALQIKKWILQTQLETWQHKIETHVNVILRIIICLTHSLLKHNHCVKNFQTAHFRNKSHLTVR